MKRVTIDYPEIIPPGTGITASRSGGRPFSVRFTLAEHRLIQDVCAQLGMSKMNFVRWCAVHVAAQLHGDGDEHDVHPA